MLSTSVVIALASWYTVVFSWRFAISKGVLGDPVDVDPVLPMFVSTTTKLILYMKIDGRRLATIEIAGSSSFSRRYLAVVSLLLLPWSAILNSLTSRGSNISSKVFKIVASSAAIIDSSVSIRKLTDADTVSSKVGDTVGSVVGALEGYDVGASESIGCLKKN